MKADQAAVNLFDQLPTIATQLSQLKNTVERATGFKTILIDNAPAAKRDVMLAEVSSEAAKIWDVSKPELQNVLDVVAAMLPNSATPGTNHTRETLLDSLKA